MTATTETTEPLFAVGDVIASVNDPGCLRTVAETHPSKPWIRVRHSAADGRAVTSHWVDTSCWLSEPERVQLDAAERALDRARWGSVATIRAGLASGALNASTLPTRFTPDVLATLIHYAIHGGDWSRSHEERS